MNPLDSTNSRAKQEPSSDGMFQTLSRYPLITWIMVLTVVLIPFLSLRMFFMRVGVKSLSSWRRDFQKWSNLEIM